MAPVDSRDINIDLVEPVFYIYSKYNLLRLNQLGNSFIFTFGDVQIIMWLFNTARKQKTLSQCGSIAGPLSATLAKQKTSTGSTPAA